MSIINRAMRKYRTDGFYSLMSYVSRRPLDVQSFGIKLLTDSGAIPVLTRKELEDRYRVLSYSSPDSFIADNYSGDQNITWLDRVNRTYSFPEPTVSEVDHVTVLEGNGFCVNKDGVIFETTLARRDKVESRIRKDPSLISKIRKKAKKTPSGGNTYDLACTLTDAGSYSKWIMKGLTRLEGIEEYSRQTGNKPHLLVPDASYIRESMDLLGYDDDEWSVWDRNEITVKNLVVPTHRITEDLDSHYTHPFKRKFVEKAVSPLACEWVRQKATESLDTGSNPERIFISRIDADERRVVNKQEVMDLLEQYGFKSYVMTELTFQEQVELFYQADCVVSPHGAGLSNLIFTNDCNVIELIGRRFKPVYYLLSHGIGLGYTGINCQTLNSDDYDIRVDVERLKEAIEAIGL